jgi:hypothetical protein
MAASRTPIATEVEDREIDERAVARRFEAPDDHGADRLSAASVDNEAIANRAFELYCERGREDGHDVDDWLQAERELRGHTASEE